MGMDVYGREPKSEVGQYFQASVWQWRPLHAAMVYYCGDLLGDKLIDAIAYNDGAGPDDQAVCDEIASRLEKVLQSGRPGFWIDFYLKVDANGCFLSPEEAARRCPNELDTAYRIEADEVHEWIKFLRHCGGFSVC